MRLRGALFVALVAACTDEDERTELLAQLEALKAKSKRIPFIDPLDIRYRLTRRLRRGARS